MFYVKSLSTETGRTDPVHQRLNLLDID